MTNNSDYQQKLVSIIVPMFNTEQYIERCLHSALNQTHRALEIIVVDDASTDASVALVKKIMQDNSYIHLIQHKTNLGSMITRRDGYEAATGDFIMFLDSDDTLPNDAVEKLLLKQQQTGADIVVGNALAYHLDGHKELISNVVPPHSTKAEAIEAIIDDKLKHCLWGKLYRSDLFRIGKLQTFVNLTISEDACLFYQLAELAKTVVSMQEVVYYYYKNTGSSTQRQYSAKQIENIIVANKVIESVCRPYTQLRKKVQHIITRKIFTLYCEKVKISTTRALLIKHGMIAYGQPRNALKFLTIADYWYAFKRYINVRTRLTK